MFCLALVLVLSIHVLQANASSAAVPRPTRDPSSHKDQCSSHREEDRILCAASRDKEASIKQVINEDETAKLEPEPPSASDKDVWAAAYEQWITGKNRIGKPKSVSRAIEEALKQHPEAQAPEELTSDHQLPELDDDELTVITGAVHNISSEAISHDSLKHALEVIEDLCYSGDNGRQLAASGGVQHLLRLAVHEATSLLSIKALATCAQNNPAVFDTAADAGAVGVLLGTLDKDHSIRAASLRALVAIGDSENAMEKMIEERERVIRAVLDSLRLSGPERRRCVVRALALVERCVHRDDEWRQHFVSAGIAIEAEKEIKNDDVDIREGAARVLQLLR